MSIFVPALPVLFVALAAARAEQPAATFAPPQEIDFRRASILSEGTRMHAELFSLKTLGGRRLPTILMAHGWGGTAANLRTVALDFARAGYLAVAFDYRGWGESDSRLILTGPAPAARPNHRFTADCPWVQFTLK
jgi:pimeloyl-ACP methyl ester carboxylesterase